MNTATRLALSGVCIFGALVFSNTINDVETSFLSTVTVAVIYQASLAALGAAAFFIGNFFGLAKTRETADEITVEQLEDEQGFEIKDIITADAKVVGVLGGKEIYENVKVVFENGFEAIYSFEDTIKFNGIENFDVTNLAPGSLILEPGIIYIPVK